MKNDFLYFFLILFFFLQSKLPGQDWNADIMHKYAESKIKAVYGFSKQSSYFKDKTNAEIVATLKAWNVNTIFGGYEDGDLAKHLHQAGIKIFIEVSFFVGEKWWQAYPGSRPIKADGKLLEKEEWYAGVNPTDPNVFQAVRSMGSGWIFSAGPATGNPPIRICTRLRLMIEPLVFSSKKSR